MKEQKVVGFRIKMLKTQNLEKPKVIREKLLYIQRVALPLKWRIANYNSEENKITLKKTLWPTEDATVTIHFDNNEVYTKLKHPKYPEFTVLKREDVTLAEIAKIFMNPRVHTSKGSYLNSTDKNQLWNPSHSAEKRIATSHDLRPKRRRGRPRKSES